MAELQARKELEKAVNETVDLEVDMLSGYWGLRIGLLRAQIAKRIG